MKGLAILGATGSVGRNALRVVRSLGDSSRVVGLSAGWNVVSLVSQVVEFHPGMVSVAESRVAAELEAALRKRGYKRPLRVVVGSRGMIEVATQPDVDLVVSASHGITGLEATYEALRAGKRLALANKEVMVVAGELVTRQAEAAGQEILPVDSEHSAIHQCMRAGARQEVRRLILTGSGGPFLRTPLKDFPALTPRKALKHPIWKMGWRITIDSATLMNKGFEVIEARWLFGLEPDRIEVLIHPQSVIHSMVEFCDGSVMAQLAVADMRLPIQYALTYPERTATNGNALSLDWRGRQRLDFEPPERKRFPCLELAREALKAGGSAPCTLNAADEVAVEAFLARRIAFPDIPRLVEKVIRQASLTRLNSLSDVLDCDREARAYAREILARGLSARSLRGKRIEDVG